LAGTIDPDYTKKPSFAQQKNGAAPPVSVTLVAVDIRP
jgi:hypothetical protein